MIAGSSRCCPDRTQDLPARVHANLAGVESDFAPGRGLVFRDACSEDEI